LNAGPGKRLGITISIINDEFYFFGGFDQGFNAHNDMWKFNLTIRKWTLLIPESNLETAPTGRYAYSSILYLQHFRYYYSGGSGSNQGVLFPIADTWYYDIKNNIYVKVLDEAPQNGRVHATSFIFDHYFFIVDGQIHIANSTTACVVVSGEQDAVNTIIFLNLDNTSLGWQFANLRTNRVGLKRLTGFLFEDQFHFGEGFGFECPVRVSASTPIWNPDLWNVDPCKIIY